MSFLFKMFMMGEDSCGFDDFADLDNEYSLESDSSDGLEFSTRPNILGGQDIFDENGLKVASSQPNVFGGQNLYGCNGCQIASSQPNILGGENFHKDGNIVGFSQPNIFGGVNLHQDGNMVGFSQPNILGGEDTHFIDSTSLISNAVNLFDGIDRDLFSFSGDPLQIDSPFKFPKLF